MPFRRLTKKWRGRSKGAVFFTGGEPKSVARRKAIAEKRKKGSSSKLLNSSSALGSGEDKNMEDIGVRHSSASHSLKSGDKINIPATTVARVEATATMNYVTLENEPDQLFFVRRELVTHQRYGGKLEKNDKVNLIGVVAAVPSSPSKRAQTNVHTIYLLTP